MLRGRHAENTYDFDNEVTEEGEPGQEEKGWSTCCFGVAVCMRLLPIRQFQKKKIKSMRLRLNDLM